jgi:outer membrane protein OmpA-like peptidoglycan-associated protein
MSRPRAFKTPAAVNVRQISRRPAVQVHPATPEVESPDLADAKSMPEVKGLTRLNSTQVLRMQNAFGNRAVQRMVARQRGAVPSGRTGPRVQRWEGQEHAKLGDATGMQIELGDGILLTWGQVIAVAGDEIGSLEELEEAVKTPAGKARIRAALESAGVPGSAAATLPAPTADQKKEQESHYYTLLLDNTTHFQSGGAALDEWRKHHSMALDRALRAGIQNPAASSTEINKAYLAEAFGQHFLTDMFSAGHIRTPRSEIADFYVNTFAPKVIDNLINNLRRRLEDGIYAQVSAQSRRARWFEGTARERIRAALDEIINENMGKLKGGKAELTGLFGKGLAGVISGAIHDAEGARGTMVNSVAQPTPWKAMGDSRLDSPENAINKQQAELAVKAGLADVQRAYEIGQDEGALKQTVPAPERLPDRIYFTFNSDAVASSANDVLEKAVAYLIYNPDTHLELVGHTDPIGTDDFNDGLGMRRAEAITRFLFDRKVPPLQVGTSTRGKKQLATTNPKQYKLNRRVEFMWTSRPVLATPLGGTPDAGQIAFGRASQALAAELGPPYRNVENFLPQEATGLNPALPDWHWDTMSPDLEKDINSWVGSRFTKDLQSKLLSSDMLKKQTVEGNDVEPRPIVEGLISEINANPMGFLRTLFK